MNRKEELERILNGLVFSGLEKWFKDNDGKFKFALIQKIINEYGIDSVRKAIVFVAMNEYPPDESVDGVKRFLAVLNNMPKKGGINA
jgi:hypothetical protein